MESSIERRIQIIIVIFSLLWHGFILISLFVLTRTELNDPLKITIRPRPIQYSLYSQPRMPKQVNQPSQLNSVQQFPAAKQIQQAVQQKSLPIPDDRDESYLVKNPVSCGTLSQGSIVTAPGGGGGGRIQAEPESDNNEQSEQPSQTKVQESDEILETAENQVGQDPHESVQAQQEPLPKATEQQPTNMTTAQQETVEFDEPVIPMPSDATTSIYSTTRTPQQAALQAHTNTTNLPQIEHRQSGKRSARPSNSSLKQTGKQLTLADITRSYVQKLKQEQHATGRYTYGSQGSAGGLPGPMGPNGVYAPPTPGTELAEQIYASKLYALLEQSAQAYSRQIFSLKDIEMQTMIEVTIDKSGKIINVSLNPALPEKDMEQALCTIVRRVGLFPPIPKQFKKTRIILNIPINIQSQKGFASYQMLYGRHA